MWLPAVDAESITNSMKNKRIPLIIKNLHLQWTSSTKAQFVVTDYENYKIKFQEPFFVGDYVCVQYRSILPNPSSENLELDENKRVTWSVHGRIDKVLVNDGQVKIVFPKNTATPSNLTLDSLSQKPCNLEIIPLQITFR